MLTFSLVSQIYSLRSLLYLSYSFRPTSLMAYWLIVTVLPPIASFTTTRALSASIPSICGAMKETSEKAQHRNECVNGTCWRLLYLSVQLFMCPRLHQHAAPRTHHQLLLLLSLLAWLGGALVSGGLQVFYRWTICAETQTFWTELVFDWLHVSAADRKHHSNDKTEEGTKCAGCKTDQRWTQLELSGWI